MDSQNISEDEIFITGDDVKHISRVLRMRENDALTVCDKCGNDYDCVISSISTDRVTVKILNKYKKSLTNRKLANELPEGVSIKLLSNILNIKSLEEQAFLLDL